MLDSLVRVSRRVAASADLLCRECPTATARLLAIQVGHDCPSGPKPGHRQHFSRPRQPAETLHQAFGPVPTVPTVTTHGDAPACQQQEHTAAGIAARLTAAWRRPTLRLDPREELRGRLRLLPYSFTYY